MNLIDVRIGSEYTHEDFGHCLVVGIHPQDPSSWVIQVFENEFEEERFDRHSELESTHFETMDCECPNLESLLTSGGTGMNEHDWRELIGVELLPNNVASGK